MAAAFEHRVYDFCNGFPIVTEDFASSMVEFFGGGHTPEIRDALLNLQKVAVIHQDEPAKVDKISKRFSFNFENDESVNVDFARALLEFFAGGHTSSIRSQLSNLEKAAVMAE